MGYKSMERKSKVASPGMVLANKTGFFSEVLLGEWDDEENYREISKEEYEKIITERNKEES